MKQHFGNLVVEKGTQKVEMVVGTNDDGTVVVVAGDGKGGFGLPRIIHEDNLRPPQEGDAA